MNHHLRSLGLCGVDFWISLSRRWNKMVEKMAWKLPQKSSPREAIIAASQVSNHGYKPCWHDTASDKLTVFTSKNKQVVQIRIQVSRVEATSVLVEFNQRYGGTKGTLKQPGQLDRVEIRWFVSLMEIKGRILMFKLYILLLFPCNRYHTVDNVQTCMRFVNVTYCCINISHKGLLNITFTIF